MSMRKSRASCARDVALFRYSLIRPLADPVLTAAERGLLEPGTVIAETTSGTFGLALAMQGVHLERKVVLVSDPVIDERGELGPQVVDERLLQDHPSAWIAAASLPSAFSPVASSAAGRMNGWAAIR